jgi:hypothetical protein
MLSLIFPKLFLSMRQRCNALDGHGEGRDEGAGSSGGGFADGLYTNSALIFVAAQASFQVCSSLASVKVIFGLVLGLTA